MPIPDTSMEEEKLSSLINIQEEYAEWCLRVLRAAFYPENKEGEAATLSDRLRDWAAETSDSQAGAVRRVMDLQTGMLNAAQKMMLESEVSQEKPFLELFDSFSDLYNAFLLQLHRVEKEKAMADSGIDMLTGLRSHSVLLSDMRKEMERLSRKGQVFSLGLGRIDHFEKIRSQLGENGVDKAVTSVAGVIRKCARVFDEAYRLEENEFLVSLKQSDINGAVSFLDRIKEALIEEEVTIHIDGETKPLTVSFFVVEPVAGDEITDLIELLKEDLNRQSDDCDLSLRHQEISPLQRFVRETVVE